mgnify:CR=1 FL=1
MMRGILFTGLVVMMTASMTNASAAASGDVVLLTDFGDRSTDLGWYVVNDNVMGGRSEGGFSIEQGELHFADTLEEVPDKYRGQAQPMGK